MPDEIITKLDEALSGIKSAQEIADRNSDRLDALDNEQIKKINDDVCNNLEKVQELEAHQKSLEKLICENQNAGSHEDEAKAVVKDEFVRHLRTGEKMSRGSFEHVIDSMISKQFSGLVNKAAISAKLKEELKYYDPIGDKKDMEVGIDPAGGYFVLPEMANTVSTRVFETSPVRQYADSVTISSDAWVEPIDDNDIDSGGWVCETGSRPRTSTPTFGEKTIYAHEQYAMPALTQKMINDAGFNVETWLENKLADKFSRIENTAFVIGDGSIEPRGFMTYPASADPDVYERGKIGRVISSASGDFTADDVKNLQNTLIENYQPNAIWMMKRKTFQNVTTKKDGSGAYLLDPNSFKTGDTKILLGAPIVFMSDFQDVAADALPIAYGDLKTTYIIVDRIGMMLLRDPYFAKPYVLLYTTKRVGGDVRNTDALKILQIAS